MGWGGTLSIPLISKLSVTHMVWLLGMVDEVRQAIILGPNKVFKFNESDVEKVFGIPAAGIDVMGKTLDRSETVFAHKGMLGHAIRGRCHKQRWLHSKLHTSYLDSINLGEISMAHDVFPRIKVFTADKTRAMINADKRPMDSTKNRDFIFGSSAVSLHPDHYRIQFSTASSERGHTRRFFLLFRSHEMLLVQHIPGQITTILHNNKGMLGHVHQRFVILWA
ncbi:hypothetical protein CFC21_104764 [Triticum aestivum]|uniref:Uncharacterized protein n=2 Tax=Triticum aestivum TaxID=4565 RepID=A0A9R1MAS6_WHEAT|nr:hypothetical protein CFC21_104764 [Triticum aestivum]